MKFSLMLGYLAALAPSLVALAWLAWRVPTFNRAQPTQSPRRIKVGNRLVHLGKPACCKRPHATTGGLCLLTSDLFGGGSTKCS